MRADRWARPDWTRPGETRLFCPEKLDGRRQEGGLG